MTSAIVAVTSTNLAAVLPFLFVGELIGLLFRELIFTISAVILASMLVALTLGRPGTGASGGSRGGCKPDSPGCSGWLWSPVGVATAIR